MQGTAPDLPLKPLPLEKGGLVILPLPQCVLVSLTMPGTGSANNQGDWCPGPHSIYMGLSAPSALHSCAYIKASTH